jgi:hypothetical protein
MEPFDLEPRGDMNSEPPTNLSRLICPLRVFHPSFGYKDGISQPGVDGFTKLNPGQKAVPPGIALLRNVGDALAPSRPDWSTDGSFLVFRWLEQMVPEFNDYVAKHPIVAPNLPPDQGSELAGCAPF